MSLLRYRYRINDKHKDGGPAVIGKYTLSRQWFESISEVDMLKSYIRTPLNKTGMLQTQTFDVDTQTVVYDSDNYLDKEIQTYTRDVLGTMKRSELIEALRMYGIDSPRLKDEKLRILILEKQDEVVV
jgi:hypothetical protein